MERLPHPASLYQFMYHQAQLQKIAHACGLMLLSPILTRPSILLSNLSGCPGYLPLTAFTIAPSLPSLSPSSPPPCNFPCCSQHLTSFPLFKENRSLRIGTLSVYPLKEKLHSSSSSFFSPLTLHVPACVYHYLHRINQCLSSCQELICELSLHCICISLFSFGGLSPFTLYSISAVGKMIIKKLGRTNRLG